MAIYESADGKTTVVVGEQSASMLSINENRITATMLFKAKNTEQAIDESEFSSLEQAVKELTEKVECYGEALKNQSIDGANIQDGTISNAKIVNLDVNKITGNVSSRIQSRI